MPELTRRRSPDARAECGQIFYGEVLVGTIAKRVGIPRDQHLWGWSCGFYPGSHPGECTGGAAATLDQARADFEKAWAVFLSSGPRPTSKSGATNRNGRSGNMPCGREADRGYYRFEARVSGLCWWETIMVMHVLPPDLTAYEAAVGDVIATCDGDLRG